MGCEMHPNLRVHEPEIFSRISASIATEKKLLADKAKPLKLRLAPAAAKERVGARIVKQPPGFHMHSMQGCG